MDNLKTIKMAKTNLKKDKSYILRIFISKSIPSILNFEKVKNPCKVSFYHKIQIMK